MVKVNTDSKTNLYNRGKAWPMVLRSYKVKATMAKQDCSHV
jgi:hypothetical protein